MVCEYVYISRDSSNTFYSGFELSALKTLSKLFSFSFGASFYLWFATKYILHSNLSIHLNGTIYKK